MIIETAFKSLNGFRGVGTTYKTQVDLISQPNTDEPP